MFRGLATRARRLTVVAILGIFLVLGLMLFCRNEQKRWSVAQQPVPVDTKVDNPGLEGRGDARPAEQAEHASPDERAILVAVEVVDRRGNAVSGGQLSALRLDGVGATPVQAEARGSLYRLHVPAEGPATWGLSYVDEPAGFLSGPHVLNKVTIASEPDSAERRLRVIAFETGSVLIEVVDDAGNPLAGVPCRTSPVSAWGTGPYLTDGLGRVRISGVVGFVHVQAGAEGRLSAVPQQLTVQPGQEKTIRLVLPRDSPVDMVPVYVDSGDNPELSGKRVGVTVITQAVGSAEGSTVVDGDPVMLRIDRHGPVTAIVKEPNLGPIVFEWQSLAEAGSDSDLRLVIGVRHRVRLRFVGRDGTALPNLGIGYRRLATGEPAEDVNTGITEFHPSGSASTAHADSWTTNLNGELLTSALRPGVYEVSTDPYRNAWGSGFKVPGDIEVQELRVDSAGVLSGRLEGPTSVAGQRVVIQARPWRDFQEKRSEIVLAMPGQFWVTEVHPDGRWALTIPLPPGSDLGCAATFPYTFTPYEMRRTLDVARVQVGSRDVLLHNAPGTWAVARIALRRGDVTALIGHAELRLPTQEDRNGLIVPLMWGQRTTVGPIAPGTYAVYYHEDVNLGPRVLGGPATNGGVRAVGLLVLAAGEGDYDIEIPE